MASSNWIGIRRSYHQISRSLEAPWFEWFSCFKIWQVSWQQCCQGVCQISERYEYTNNQSHDFRDLAISASKTSYQLEAQGQLETTFLMCRDSKLLSSLWVLGSLGHDPYGSQSAGNGSHHWCFYSWEILRYVPRTQIVNSWWVPFEFWWVHDAGRGDFGISACAWK